MASWRALYQPDPGCATASTTSPTPSGTSSRRPGPSRPPDGRSDYLNIGDPIPFGFKTPAHLVDAVVKAMRDGANSYVPFARHPAGARGGRHGMERARVSRHPGPRPDHRRHLGRHRAGADGAGQRQATACWCRCRRIRCTRRCSRRSAPTPAYYRTDPARGWLPDLDHLESLITPRTRALVLIDPNNPTGAVYPTPVRRAVLDLAERHGLVVLADEVYGDVAYDGPVPPLGSLDPDGPIVAFSSLSKAYLAPGWRTGGSPLAAARGSTTCWRR